MPPEPANFDDAYGLDAADFSGVRLVLFCGVSGSGKSTAITHLCQTHPDFRQRESAAIHPSDTQSLTSPRGRLVVVEELRRPRDLYGVAGLLRRGATVLAASHLAPVWLVPLRLAVKSRCYTMDRDWHKIARHLERRGISYTPQAVQAYCRKYGANYIDLDIIVEHFPGVPFDQALSCFERFCRIDLRPRTK